MLTANIFMGLISFTFFVLVWVFAFFVFDEVILGGYFKQKLRNRFKVENDRTKN